LDALRNSELLTLRDNAGTLPGDMLYPIKRAKELLELAFSFDAKAQTNLLAYMANQRLNEAIVLLGQNESDKAQKALSEYQDLVQQITSQNTVGADKNDPLVALVAAHKKALVASLPSNVQIVSKVLDQTEEMMAHDPVKLIQVKLSNSIDDLNQAYDSASSGDLKAAEAILASHKAITSDLLGSTDSMTEDMKKTLYADVLDAQYEEKRLLADIGQTLAAQNADQDLLTLAQTQRGDLEGAIRQTVASIRPTMPDVVLAQAAAFSKAQKAREFADKISLYKTWQGEKNEVKHLISLYPQYLNDQEFWGKVRDNLDGTAKVVIESRMADLQNQEDAQYGHNLQQIMYREAHMREVRENLRRSKTADATDVQP
jgi:Domain of unknown function (DUF5667)